MSELPWAAVKLQLGPLKKRDHFIIATKTKAILNLFDSKNVCSSTEEQA